MVEVCANVSNVSNVSAPDNFSMLSNMRFKSFYLSNNSKLPEKNGEWNKVNRYKWKMRSLELLRKKNINKTGINFGVPCGLVNKCFVLDMDLYKLKDRKSEFIERFGEDYINFFDTFTCKTGSGGEHLYFKYDKDIKTTTCAFHEIDIRSNGSYAVAPYANINEKEYKIIKLTKIRKCPPELKEWILNNLYKKSRKITDKVKKDKNGDILNPVCKKQLSYQNEVDLSAYKYSFSDTILRKIFNSLDPCFYENYEDFLIVATCLKTMGKREYFEEICETKLDKKHLKPGSSWGIHSNDMWDSCEYKAVNTLPFLLRECDFIYESVDPAIIKSYEKYNKKPEYIQAKTDYYTFLTNFKPNGENNDPLKLLKQTNPDLLDKIGDLLLWESKTTQVIKDFLGYYMYKPANNHTIKPDMVIENQRYLDGDTPGSFIEQFRCGDFGDLTTKLVIVKSDTGTGKTTAMKNFLKNNPDIPFISIVSRLSLGKEQNEVFCKAGIDSNWFKDVSKEIWSMEGENLVIQVDSLVKLSKWEEDIFNSYVIYLDEFNSLIEYFIDCPNLDDKRICIKRMLKRIIVNAEQVIMTDAHISDTCMKYLEQLGLGEAPKIFVENKYKHNAKNGGIKTRELYDNEDITLELQYKLTNNEPFMVCCDSKNVCDVLYHELNRDKRIGLFTSETMEDIDLDKWDFVIFSPKIVYGLDSVMERPVYCIMKEHTISPLAMIQQANRCRNITELIYFFGRKSHGLYKYENVEEVLDELNKVEENANSTALANCELLCSEEETENYKQLLAHHLYIQDCFSTNKFAHFLDLLKGQGFCVDIKRKKSYNSLQTKSKEVKEFKEKALLELFEEEQENIESFKKMYYNEIPEQIQDELDLFKKELVIWEEKNKVRELQEQNKLTNNLKEDWSERLEEISSREEILKLYGSGEKGDLWCSYNKDKLIDDSVYPKYIQNNIKLLSIQPENVGNYEKILTDNHKITNHFRICKFWFKEESDILEKLEKKVEYSCKKGASSDFKILFLKKVLKELKVEDYKLDPDCSAITPGKNNKLLDEYRVVFTDRNKKKKISFDNEKDAQQLIVKMYKNIFGATIINSKKSTKTTDSGVKSITYYALNMDLISQSQELYKESKLGINDNPFTYAKNTIYSKIVY